MAIYSRPQFWWRAGIVLCAAAGLLSTEHRILYFTAQTNIVALGYFAGLLYWMVRRNSTEPAAPRLRGAVTLWILITALISHFLLAKGANPLPGLTESQPTDLLWNWSAFLVHYVVPGMILIDWLAFGPRRTVHWRDIPLWILYPLGYGLLIEARAILLPAAPIRYPYFFLDPTERGYDWVAGQFLQLAAIFSVLGAALVALDRLAALATTHRTTGRPATEPPAAEPGKESSPPR